MIARRAGVAAFVVPAIQAAGWPGLLCLCAAEPDLHPALGLHPVFLPQHRTEDLGSLERLLESERPLAVGEIGLDYFRDLSPRPAQFAALAAQLELAAKVGQGH